MVENIKQIGDMVVLFMCGAFSVLVALIFVIARNAGTGKKIRNPHLGNGGSKQARLNRIPSGEHFGTISLDGQGGDGGSNSSEPRPLLMGRFNPGTNPGHLRAQKWGDFAQYRDTVEDGFRWIEGEVTSGAMEGDFVSGVKNLRTGEEEIDVFHANGTFSVFGKSDATGGKYVPIVRNDIVTEEGFRQGRENEAKYFRDKGMFENE